jgi:hypothetical protein
MEVGIRKRNKPYRRRWQRLPFQTQPRLVHAGGKRNQATFAGISSQDVVKQDRDRFTARLKQFNQPLEKKNKGLKSPAQPNNLRAPITPRFQNSKGREGSDNDG